MQALSARADLSTGYVKGSMADSAVQPRAVEKVMYTVFSPGISERIVVVL